MLDGPLQRRLSIAVYMHDLTGGGVERQNLKLIRAFGDAGHNVTLLLHNDTGELGRLVPANLAVRVFRTGRTLQDVPHLVSFLRRQNPDVLLSSLDHNNVAALLAKAIARTRTQVVICQHNGFSAEATTDAGASYRSVRLSYRWLSGLASRIVAVSEGVGADVSKQAGIGRDKITVIHNPVIGPDFEDRAAEPLHHPWFEQADVPVYVTAGRLVLLKDHATLLRAFAMHLKRRDARLMILGSGPMASTLEALAAELEIRHAVAFLGFQANPLPYMRRASGFVISSRFEGFCNALVEALGCGTPVISTDCPFGPREILENGRYGLLVPPGMSHALANAMDTDLRARWTPEILKTRSRQFTDEICASKYLGLFHALVDKDQFGAA